MEIEDMHQDIVAYEAVKDLILNAVKIFSTLGCTEETDCSQCILCHICDDLFNLLRKVYPETGLRRKWIPMED